MGRDLPDFTREMHLDVDLNLEILTELARHLGGIPRISRTGKIFLLEDFSHGKGRWLSPTNMGGGTVEILGAGFHTGGHSLYIIGPDETPCAEGIVKTWPYLEGPDKIGLEICWWAIWSDYFYVNLSFRTTDSGMNFIMRAKYDGNLEVIDENGDYQVVTSLVSNPAPLNKWWTAKLVVDFSTKKYHSLQVGNKAYSVSSIYGQEAAAEDHSEFWLTLSMESDDTPESTGILDYIVLTDED